MSTSNPVPPGGSRRGWLKKPGEMMIAVQIGLVFLMASVLFAFDLLGRTEPLPAVPKVPPGFADPHPVRVQHPVLRLEGQKCSECHNDLENDPDKKDPVGKGKFHKQVVLAHGGNNRCFNCHHPDNKQRDDFVAYDGSVIPAKDVELLCAKCHGPHYRDWKAGSHGRRDGYWDTRRGERHTLACTSCHHSHSPAFKPIASAPGPHTLHGSPREQVHE